MGALAGSFSAAGGVALELELEGGVLLEPAPAAPLLSFGDGLALLDEDEAPPLALSFFSMSTEVDEELEPDGAAVLPDGAVEDELDGLSHAVISEAPNARDTATAIIENLM